MSRSLGRVLRAAREQVGLNQTAAAETLGVDQGNLSKRENDRIGVPSAELERFVEATGVSLTLGPEGWAIHEPPVGALPCFGKVPCGYGINIEEAPATEVDLADLTDGAWRDSRCYLLQAQGDSMEGAGIYDGDWLIVDSHRQPQLQQIVVATLNAETMVKRLVTNDEGRLMLAPANVRYRPVELQEWDDLAVQGVVIGKLKYIPLA